MTQSTIEEEIADGDRQAKIACSGVWKIYGRHADERLADWLKTGMASMEIRDEALAVGLMPAVCDVSFHVPRGESFVIMGLSGSGKSTVVRCLCRLIDPSAGSILLDGRSVPDMSEAELIAMRRREIGMVFQNFGLLPHLTVLENVVFPLRIQGINRESREQRARETIELVGLAGREDSFPSELSGGQQQRVGVARSLAVDPDVWLLDEPFSALDPLIRRQMQDEFLRLQTILNKTVVFITHDFLEAVRLGERIAIMKEGRIVQIGSPAELILNPADDYVRAFTSEVPRSRVLTAGALVEPLAAGQNSDGPAVEASATLETLVAMVAGGMDAVTVTGSDRRVIGCITGPRLRSVLAEAGA